MTPSDETQWPGGDDPGRRDQAAGAAAPSAVRSTFATYGYRPRRRVAAAHDRVRGLARGEASGEGGQHGRIDARTHAPGILSDLWPRRPRLSTRRPTSSGRSSRWSASSSDEQILPNAEHYDAADEFPAPIVEQMKELGLFGVTIPEEYGGMGLDLTTYTMIVEELSRGWISISGVINTHFIGSYLLMKFGTDEQKERFLPADGHRRDPRRLLAVASPSWAPTSRPSRPPASRTTTATGRSTARRCGSPTASCPASSSCSPRTDRDVGQAPPGHDLLHLREGAGRGREHRRVEGPRRPAQDQEDGLQGRRVHRARLRRLPAARRRTSSAARTTASTRASRR